jgi:paraquat-inducible protein B
VSQKANPTLIGAFVMGGVIIGVAALLLLGSGKLFHRMRPFILFLQGDVTGLRVGSPVRFQGVQVGAVTGIRLLITPEGAKPVIPVTILLDENVIQGKSGTDVDLNADTIHKAIEHGLRARLDTDSLLTGQRSIALDIAPEMPAKLLGLSKDMEEIPTVPGSLEEIRKVFKQLQDVDFKGVVEELAETSRALRQLVAAPETQSLPASLQKSIDGIDRLVAALHDQVGPIGSRIDDTSKAVQHVATELETTMKTLRPSLESMRATAERTKDVEDELAKTLASARTMLDPNAPLVVQLQSALQEFAATARSLRALSDLIERDPSVLLRGKGAPSKP